MILCSQVAQYLNNQPANAETQETQVMATHSSMLAWKNLWTEEPAGLQSAGS